ncbi:MAG: hypothetical protein QF815_00205, partial [Candidatus Peribacteraceae bacterium]|nr:hypothetical protein [Candidatus Peribacteraceae bacterium]
FTLALLTLSGQVFAEIASPPAVTGTEVSQVGDEASVTWDAVTSDPISYYRVYYSGESILDNDGVYDDFETTEADETSLKIMPPSDIDTIFVAVIAVAESGLESEFFTDEASITIDRSDSPVEEDDLPPLPEPIQYTTPPPAPVQTEEAGPVRLMKGDVISPTEISIQFSSSLTVDSKSAPEGLQIEDANGEKLQITSITIDRNTVIIFTETQQRGAVYNVQFSEPFAGKNGEPLDSNDRTVLVTGHANGNDAPPPPVVRAVDPYAPPDVTNITLVPEVQPNGAYSVKLEWEVDNSPGDLYGIVVYQTRDGQTFGPPSLLPIDIGGLQMQDVTPGFIGLYIQTMNIYGSVSQGIFQYANLPYYIPGYGFYGHLTQGATQNGVEIYFDEPSTEEVQEENIATIEVITEDTPTQSIENVDHSAAVIEVGNVNWKSAAILVGGTAVVMILIIGSFVMVPRRKEEVPTE